MPPYCASCNRFLRCAKNGVFLRIGHNLWRAGDRYECRGCGANVISGFGHGPGDEWSPEQVEASKARGVEFFIEKDWNVVSRANPAPSDSDRVAEQPGPF